MGRRISVVIATYNRIEDLIRTLDSLNNQTLLPDEIIIIDESPQDNRKLIKLHSFRFLVKYIWKNSKFRSLARSRNVGKKVAKGEIVIFLDDDVILKPDFIENIVKAFERYPNVVGVMGVITNVRKYSLFYFLLNLVFLRFLQYKPKVRRSFFPCYPYRPREKVIKAEWLNGANMAYRRDVLESNDFEWRLLKYSYSEDVDFSYSIYRKYKNRIKTPLIIISSAKLLHHHAPSGRLLPHPLEKTRRVINLYMLYKHFGDTKLNILIFLWWNLGEIVEILLTLRKISMKERLKHVMLIISLVKFSLENLSKIRHGEILRFQ